MSRTHCQIIFVDLQGFIVDERFKIKELAILKRGKELIHYIFHPNIPWDLMDSSDRSRVIWLMHNHHGLQWNDGDTDHRQARALLVRWLELKREDEEEEDDDREILVYVKGLQKKRWLEELLQDMRVHIETMDDVYDGEIGRLSDLSAEGTFSCGRHTSNCAMENVMKLYKWWSSRECK